MRLTQRGTYTRLLAAILLVLLVLPLVGNHVGHPRWLSVVFFMLVLFAALDATQAARKTRVIVWSTGVIAILTSGLSFAVGDEAGNPASEFLDQVVGVVNHGSSVVFLGIVVWLLIQRAMAAGRVTGERIVAAVCAYLLMGILWSEAYQVLGAVYGPVIAQAGAEAASPIPYRDYLYFSYVTLTTLGYGDFLPVHASARSLAYLEAVTGVLYLATLVARLVALHIAHESLDGIVEDAIDDAVDEALAERDQDGGSSAS